MSNLREALRQRIERDRLSEERLAALEALQARAERAVPATAPGPASTQHQPWRTRRWALAALPLVVVLLVVLWWWQFPPPEQSEATRLAQIADEVAGQHLHLKPLEVEAGDLDQVRRYLNQLDFRPLASDAPALADLNLQGGRYCSIQGVPAAQLRLRPDASQGEASGEDVGVQTLYQARYDPEHHGPLPDRDRGEAPVRLRARGLTVLLWVEGGVVFALVRDD
ncbi:hypothetical protein [Halochromatium glycolicum]|uniref:Uncharacterized protein n=1 Tax=Halochromatium glycolicum TaxID=85075 RepID=A0AAJ0XA70_9GAMM|nr:hypothetical protein [Halochromatium glycolicum]MBK1705516.1 hypothetical protein [Halochromatium glycolicum]